MMPMTLEEFVTATSAETAAASDMTTRREILAELKNISALLAGRLQPAVLDRDAAAEYIGLRPESFDKLAQAVPGMKPVSPMPGVVVWRRADLDAFIESLAQ